MIIRKTTKHILWGLSFFLVVVAGIFVVNYIRKPQQQIKVKLTSPQPIASPETPQIFEVGQALCNLSFSVKAPLIPGLNCKTKELYKNVSTNTAGNYALTGNKLADGYQLITGETYLYVINYENTGTGGTSGSITDTLPTGTVFVDASTGCANVSGKVTCTLGTVNAGQSGQKVIRFKVNAAAASYKNIATLTPAQGTASTCSITNYLMPSPTPSPIPSPTPSPIPSKVPSPSPSTPASPIPSPSPSLAASPTPTPSSPAGAALDCVVKRAYENDSRNSSGTYYLNNEIVDTNTLSNGQTIVYNIVTANNGGVAASDVIITDVLSNNLTYVDASSGCNYNSGNRTVTCNIGSLSGGTQASKSIRVTVGVSGTTAIANTARVSSTNGQQDSCSLNINATGQVVLQPSPIPSELPEAGVFTVTAGTLSIGAVLLILGLLGLLLL